MKASRASLKRLIWSNMTLIMTSRPGRLENGALTIMEQAAHDDLVSPLLLTQEERFHGVWSLQ